MSPLPSGRGLAITVLDRAESFGQGAVSAVRDINPEAVDALIGAVERVPALVGRVAGVLGDVEQLVPAIDQVRVDASTEVMRVEQTRSDADQVAGGAAVLVERAGILLGQAELLLGRAGRLFEDVEAPVRRLLPAVEALADMSDPGLPELIADLGRRWPAMLSEMTDDVVPALAVMRDAVPDLLLLRELGQRLEPLVTDVSATMAGLPGARRAQLRGTRSRADAAGDVPMT